MTIVAAEIKWFKAQEHSDAGTNGGHMSANESVSGVKNNIWPDVPQAEREAGSTKYRKMFIKVGNVDNLALQASKLFVENYTAGEDAVVIFPGNQSNVQSELTGTERVYGCGKLDADIAAGTTTITVLVEDAALDYFRDGDLIRISDQADVGSAGNVEYATVSGAPTYVGNVATVTLAAGTGASYSAANTRVASVIDAGTIAALADVAVVTSAGGTFDDTGFPVVVDAVGGVEDDWTLTFTSSTQFSIVGTRSGDVGTGTISTETSPVNSAFGEPFFSIDPAAFGGSFAAGDTIQFSTHPAAYPLWYKRVVPAGAGSLGGNKVTVAVDGESA